MQQQEKQQKRHYDVTVLGAGLAGLYCAKTLLEHSSDISVCLIEARDRTGGRTFTEALKIDQFAPKTKLKKLSKEEVGPRSDWGPWCQSENMYLPQEELVNYLLSDKQNVLVVDCRDEDVRGGRVAGSLNIPDGEWDAKGGVLLDIIDQMRRNLPLGGDDEIFVIFHCMESLRRGPRCARRFYLHLQEEGQVQVRTSAKVTLKILEGGADRWVRKHYKNSKLVHDFDDDYWGFEEFEFPIDSSSNGSNSSSNNDNSRSNSSTADENSKKIAEAKLATIFSRVTDKCLNECNDTIPVESVDLGGQWVGPLHSTLLGLIRNFKLELLDQEFTCSQSSNSGRLVELTGITMSSLSPAELNELVAFSGTLEDLAIKLKTSGSYFNSEECQELDRLSVTDYANKYLKSESVRNEILLFVQTILACDPTQCSMMFLVHYIGSSGGMETLGDGELGAQKWKISGGSMQVSRLLLDLLIVNYGSGGRFSYVTSTSIAKIELHSDSDNNNYKSSSGSSGGSSSSSSSENANYNVCNMENVMIARSSYVVVALAPGLAIKTIKFQPQSLVHEDRRQLFDSYRMGSVIKVILFYEGSFWSSSAGSRNMSVSSLLNFFDIHNIFITHSSNGLPGLVLLITGAHAKKLSTILSSSEAEFRDVIFRQLSLLYEVDLSVTSSCSSFSYKDWTSDSFAAGCFVGVLPPLALTNWFTRRGGLGFDNKASIAPNSSIQPSSSSFDDNFDLSQNISASTSFNFSALFETQFDANRPSSGSRSGLYWASSETSEKFCGYMEGALLSGERQAMLLLEDRAKREP